MKHVSHNVTIAANVRSVYRQWTRFEEVAHLLQWSARTSKIDETRVMWCMRIWGKEMKWRTHIDELVPDQYIAWRSYGRCRHLGSVTFDAIDEETTRVTVALECRPRTLFGRLWAAFGAIEWHLASALGSFQGSLEAGSKARGWGESIHKRKHGRLHAGFQPFLARAGAMLHSLL